MRCRFDVRARLLLSVRTSPESTTDFGVTAATRRDWQNDVAFRIAAKHDTLMNRRDRTGRSAINLPPESQSLAICGRQEMRELAVAAPLTCAVAPCVSRSPKTSVLRNIALCAVRQLERFAERLAVTVIDPSLRRRATRVVVRRESRQNGTRPVDARAPETAAHPAATPIRVSPNRDREASRPRSRRALNAGPRAGVCSCANWLRPDASMVSRFVRYPFFSTRIRYERPTVSVRPRWRVSDARASM